MKQQRENFKEKRKKVNISLSLPEEVIRLMQELILTPNFKLNGSDKTNSLSEGMFEDALFVGTKLLEDLEIDIQICKSAK